MLIAITSVYSCDSNCLLGKYDIRSCILKATTSTRVTQLTFWIDSGSRKVVFTPKQKSNSLNLCQILADTFGLEPSDVALVSATFENGDKKGTAHGEFRLQDDVNTVIEIKQSTQ